MAQKTYDEYSVGEVFESYGRTITEADIVNYTCFAGLKLPMFIDEEFSQKHSLFKTRVAPGLMTASIAAGMLEDILGKYTLAALGLDRFKFSAPVKAGDTLHTRITVEGLKDTSTADRGVINVKIEVVNQEGAVPCVFHGAFMMRKGNL
ncbi:MaoC/PaaZ C-terminal domain-containing protein [Bordetella sp. BOR01]|uniref:MaoC family dehydratase n=1 Tax=Bordetella sp. BOR01 TaxID=2854779 RepID=UPI001C48CE83|nr:MaoC/PaaZ C-terminal domain-containing protein [Bordetella sp. BOR01]MBV7485331.1 MaoC family dehydratase N-terminal domain-containing protein [Bordetella sp. BOR01]